MKPLMSRPATRTILAGTVLGLLILGIGGRVAMALISHQTTGAWRSTVGGTVTVVALGAASGFAGALLALSSRWAMRRLIPGRAWPQYAVFFLLLLLVTLRGLRGTPAVGFWYFPPLVVLYGVILAVRFSYFGDTRSADTAAQSHLPSPLDNA